MAKKTKGEQILVRLMPSEKRAFRVAAELSGITLSSWIRERLRREARKELMEANMPVDFLELREPNDA